MSTSRKRKAQRSPTQTPTKNPHQNHPQEQDPKCEEQRSKDQIPFTIPYIPTPIIIEILSSVPIKTLFSCILVCKNWAALVSTQEFAQLHLSRSPTSCLIKPLYQKTQSRRLHLVDPESPCNKVVFIPKISLPNVLIGLTNSCNGLVCLCQLITHFDNEAANIYVCNPVLREYITLPKPARAIDFDSDDCAFGFSHSTNQYKVVLRYYSSGKYSTKIYTLGEGSWRNIANCPYPIQNHNFCAFLNGALHCIIFDLCIESYIGSFDFESEQFRAIPEPSEFDLQQPDYCDKMQVGVINGNLSICDLTDFTNADCYRTVIWVMKDYGVKESWSKDFVITHKIHHFDTYEPIMRKGNGKILMILNNESIKLYDPKSKAFESELKITGVYSEFHAIAHVPSLISLKDVAKGENLKVLGSN